MPIIATTRQCYAGWHLSPEGVAYDFQGLCQPGEMPSQQSSRTCDVPYYRAAGSNVFYDTRGYCDPAKTQLPGEPPGSKDWIWTLVMVAGVGLVGYWVWKNRRRIF